MSCRRWWSYNEEMAGKIISNINKKHGDVK